MSDERDRPAGPLAGTHRTDAVTDVALTLPNFVAYHLGVIFLPVRNAADMVTSRLADFANHSQIAYLALTLGIGSAVAFAMLLFGHREKLRWESFAMVAIEGVVYAMAMRHVAAWAIGNLPMGPAAALAEEGPLTGVVMSLGAGFYEELAFRAVLFGLGAKVLLTLDDWSPFFVYPLWALACAAGFSAWHHVGPLGEPFELRTFVFRTVCGLVFTLIYGFRGFAPAVWTHTLYDLWVMVF